MSILTPVPYFAIAHDDDGRIDRSYDREFEMALRWNPASDYEDDALGAESLALINTGQSVLRRLRQGDDVARRHLDYALTYLADAIGYYDKVAWEPYPGRNAEAAADLRALLELVTPRGEAHLWFGTQPDSRLSTGGE